MAGIVRQGDMAIHGGYSPQFPIQFSPNVFVDGLPVVIKGCAYCSHTDGDDTHDGIAAGSGGTVFSNGQPIQVVGNMVSCGSIMIQGSGSAGVG